MDTTPKYILMCEKAEEIQKIRQADDAVNRHEWWQPGDFVYDGVHEEIFIVCGVRHCLASTGYFDIDHITWLPRQDQLQEMVYPEYFAPLQTMCGVLYDFSISEYGGRFTLDGSMEQLWLAFVMHEKYQKRWNEEKQEWTPSS